jgi:1,4-dihydroxy-6-naphthoate synthase
MKTIDVAFSPCPNDTFIFHALMHGFVDTGNYRFAPHVHDVESLNRAALESVYSVTKLSFYTYLLLHKTYRLLDSGAALGYGCGPLLVAGSALRSGKPLKDMTIAVPGLHTTAYLLLRLWLPGELHVTVRPFDVIIDEVAAGRYDAGLIIHEGRFIFQRHGLDALVDLGQWWEDETGMPIPLGCIAMKQDLGTAMARDMASMLRASVSAARANPSFSRGYLKSLAQEMDDSVIDEHIRLYVYDFTLDLGERGRAAIAALEDRAGKAGLI